MAKILVTDGEQRSALASVRSLGRAGHTVYVASHRSPSLAGSSRYVRESARVAEPLQSPDEFVLGVVALIERWNIDLLLPVTEAAVMALLPDRARIPAVLPFPQLSAFQRLCDKGAVAAEARALGIGVPSTVAIASRQALSDVASELRFPIILKPHRSVIEAYPRRKIAVRRVADATELDAVVSASPDEAFPLLVQEVINGPGIGVFVLLVDGEMRAAFAHRRIREKPPWGGVSVYRESIPLDENLLARSVKLLRRFEFEGAAMVEYKVDAATQVPYIMEINGRLWGSLQLAIDAGVDFPALLVDAFLNGSKAVASRSYKAVRSRWFWGDVDNLLLRLRSGGGESGDGGSSRLRACMDFVRGFGSGSRNEVFRLNDPVPGFRETLDWFGALKATRRDHECA